MSQEQPAGLGRTKRLASQHRQLPPKQGHNQRRSLPLELLGLRVNATRIARDRRRVAAVEPVRGAGHDRPLEARTSPLDWQPR